MNDRRLWAIMAVVVLVIWLVGAAVTKFSLEQMAFVTPIAVVVVGATPAVLSSAWPVCGFSQTATSSLPDWKRCRITTRYVWF